MKLLICTLALLTSANVFADNLCTSDAGTLHADYQIRYTDNDQHIHTSELHLWRQGHAVAQQYPATQITQAWEHEHNRLKPYRHFDAYKRTIEYQPGEAIHGKLDTDWSYRYQLISDALIQAMTEVSESGEGCDKIQHLTYTQGEQTFTLDWQPALKLIKYFEVTTPKGKTVWQRETLSFDAGEIKQFFAVRSNYKSTDFADIGDDHTDPFLTSMVHQGFIEPAASGFYDDKGNALEGVQSH